VTLEAYRARQHAIPLPGGKAIYR